MPEDKDPAAAKAEQALGYYDAEFTRCGRFDPPHDALPVVNFRYVPLPQNAVVELADKLEKGTKADKSRADVRLLVERLRQWDLRRRDGAVADCRDAADIGVHVDPAIVRGIAAWILDSRHSAEAEAALADFPKP